MLSRALGGKRKRGKERVTHRNFAKKYFLCTSKRHFNVSQSFSLKFCTCLSHKRKLLVCKSQLLFSVGFELITKIEGAIFFETSCTQSSELVQPPTVLVEMVLKQLNAYYRNADSLRIKTTDLAPTHNSP